MVLEGLTPGDELDNDQLCAKFMCSPQGGMRYSKRTESLVLVSNHVKSLYDDRWIENVLHYTGMGTIGDQSLAFMQNKTLYLSNENGVVVYLFEVFQEKRYTYTGRVHLSAQPYQEIQEDVEGRERKVWIFPLKLLNAAPPVKAAILEQLAQHKAKQAKKLSVAELRKRVQSAPKIPGSQRTKTVAFQRNPYVCELAQRRANGVCQLCQQPAPFSRKDHSPYLEVHHVIWLSAGGEDSLSNTVALCPNCHRKMHVLARKEDVEQLQQKAQEPYTE
ncbi:HNH endonuclease signature motif containing protein [Bilophila wadsworthia]|uniref:HNH endonuclease n=2 Tax=Bilophila wadsworthia TaxID=35833 RepID=UPI0028EDB408|nr:HNH endonuclease signature motif containing protein [Bilophila wadsworthia]